METLAVVAYRQPVLRAEIEAIRGVACGEILRQLMERDLVRIAGRSDDLGRPFLYGTTRRFLQVFGLRHLDDLPRPELVRSTQTGTQDPGAAADVRGVSRQPLPNQTVVITQTEGDSNVKIDVDPMALRRALSLERTPPCSAPAPSRWSPPTTMRTDGLDDDDDDDELDDDDPDSDDDLDDDEDDLDDEEDSDGRKSTTTTTSTTTSTTTTSMTTTDDDWDDDDEDEDEDDDWDDEAE